jgi:hypothetical protein
MKNHLLLIIAFVFSLFANAQTGWRKIAQLGPDLIVTSETNGYSFENTKFGSHAFISSLRSHSDYFQTTKEVRKHIPDNSINVCYRLQRMYFLDAKNGFISENCGGFATIYRTADSAKTWENMNIDGYYSISMEFLTPDFGYLNECLKDPTPTPGNSISHFFTNTKSTDITLTKYLIYPVYRNTDFINDSTGFLICRDSLGKKGAILKTTDYGKNWVEQKLLDSVFFNDIFFLNDTMGFVIGSKGTILKTKDSGLNWEQLSNSTTQTLNAIDFLTNGTGYIVGENGTLLKSTDFGSTWVPETFINSENLHYVKVFNNRVYANSKEGNLYSNLPPVGIHEELKDAFTVSPNPVTNYLNINTTLNLNSFQLTLYDVCGKKMQVPVYSSSLDMSMLSKGVYLLEIRGKEGVATKKIIKE